MALVEQLDFVVQILNGGQLFGLHFPFVVFALGVGKPSFLGIVIECAYFALVAAGSLSIFYLMLVYIAIDSFVLVRMVKSFDSGMALAALEPFVAFVPPSIIIIIPMSAYPRPLRSVSQSSAA